MGFGLLRWRAGASVDEGKEDDGGAVSTTTLGFEVWAAAVEDDGGGNGW